MELTVDSRDRLDKFLARTLTGLSRSKLVRHIEEGLILVDGDVEKPSFMVEPGMLIEVSDLVDRPAHDLSPADIPLDVLYEDEALLVVNKPRGLATHPATSLKEPSLVNALLGRSTVLSSVGEDFRPGIVHRLDKETTGLLVVAKTDAAHANLAEQIASKTADRRYFAIVGERVTRERFIVDAPIRRDPRDRMRMTVHSEGKPARTHVIRVAELDGGAVLAIRLETGRTHQIRVHLSAVNLSVKGDTLYSKPPYNVGPLQLHAAYLAFAHPSTGERIVVFAYPPDDFEHAGTATRAAIEQWTS